MSRKLLSLLTLGAVIVPLVSITPALAQTAPPPPLQTEVIPIPPPPGAYARPWVWQPGYWRWNGREYRWVAGHYVRGPRAGAIWIPGEWVVVRGRYVWRAGHWRR
ncbi:MAG TPA: hypothetical protein VJR47_10340 [Stellaceae bacterium]|nr:hypothetical protein [Stellaceae bacterium]